MGPAQEPRGNMMASEQADIAGESGLRLGPSERRLGIALWGRVARFYARQLRLASTHLRGWDLSLAQFDALAMIGRHNGLTQQELAARLLVTQGNITQLLDKLERRGLLRRCPEGRVNRLVLTEAGKQLHDLVVPEQEDFQARQFGRLTFAEQRQLLGLLRKLQRPAQH
jgi:DNA-binding MarR family transcriptional regulator